MQNKDNAWWNIAFSCLGSSELSCMFSHQWYIWSYCHHVNGRDMARSNEGLHNHIIYLKPCPRLCKQSYDLLAEMHSFLKKRL